MIYNNRPIYDLFIVPNKFVMSPSQQQEEVTDLDGKKHFFIAQEPDVFSDIDRELENLDEVRILSEEGLDEALRSTNRSIAKPPF